MRENKIDSWPGSLSVWSWHVLPRVCVVSSRFSGVLHTPQLCALGSLVRLSCLGLSAGGCVSGSGWRPAPGWSPTSCPELLGEMLAVCRQTRSKWLGKELSGLFLLIFLKCMYSSHWLQCLILKVFWVFIEKFGEVSMTRNRPPKLKSCLC